MNQIKMLVTDLDGTLLRKDKTISEKTIHTLIEFKNQGNEVVFATSRPPRIVKEMIPQELKKEVSVICYNGACVIDEKSNVVYEKDIEEQNVKKMIEIAEKYGYHNFSFEINDELFSNFDTTYFFGNCPNEIISLEKMNFETTNKMIICSQTPITEECQKALMPYGNAIITDRGELCQIMNQDVNKWQAILALLSQKKLKPENVIAFGDDYNDYDMIKNAGIGVAMQNGEERIKEIANYVTGSNEQDGVATFICEHLLGEVEVKLRNMTSIYLYNEQKQFWLLERIGSRVVKDNSYTGTAGGHFEKEELNDAMGCVLRELQEETGLTINDIQNLEFKYVTLRYKNNEIRQNYYFFAQLNSNIGKIESNEGKLKLVEESELRNLVMPHTSKYVIDHYLKEGKNTTCKYAGVAVEDGVNFVKLEDFQ